MRKLKTLLQSRYFFKILLLFFLIYACLVIKLDFSTSKYTGLENKISGRICDIKIDGNKLRIILNARERLIVNYYFRSKEEKKDYQQKLQLGDTIVVDGTLEKPDNNTIFNGFNYRRYLENKKIYYLVSGAKITKIKNNTSVYWHLKTLIIDRIEKIDKTGYLKIFILGDKQDVDGDTLENYRMNGVSHLFSISGMHISLLASIILFFLTKFSYNIKLNYLVVIAFLMFYLFLTDVSPSILRTVVMFILMAINRSYNLKIGKVDIMLLVIMVIIVINPCLLRDVGFQFSYLISFTLITIASKIKRIKGNLRKNLYISWVCFLVSFPIVVYNFNQVNFLSIFFNILLIPLVSTIVFPLALLCFVFPIFSNIFNVFVFIMEGINDFCSNLSFLQIIFCRPSLWIILIYYIVIFLTLYNNKYLFVFLALVLIHNEIKYFDDSLFVTMLDVGQGDSIFLQFPYNEGNILIDTGGIVSYKKEKWAESRDEYSIVKSRSIPYLKSIGIDRINYLILSHGDFDHMGEAINLIKNFRVENVVFNCGCVNYLEKELIKELKKRKINYYSCLDKLNIAHYKLQFLNTRLYDNENDDSNVIYLKYNKYKFLFMGDAGKLKEKDILAKYNLGRIDFLKVGHHGSNTSSSSAFINNVNPKYSLISVGENNRYGHPKESVLDILKSSKIYRTDRDGSIEVRLNDKGYRIRNCEP